MSVYYGFFDAKFEESTASYDREYDSADFTQYFGEIIGSGVCIHDNPDSMRVSMQDSSAVIAPGYLFIDGYWLKNDADYVVSLPADGVYAVLAQLDLGNRLIRIDVQPKREDTSYPDALVLAFADAQGNVEDTRYDTPLCGVIGSAGSLATKIEFAIQYIDTEIEGRLEQAEAQINAKVEELDAKIAEVDAQVAKLAPPAVGTIKFSASQSIEEGWLKCDGSFVNETDYPELVAALGKLTPSGDKFVLLSDGEIGGAITNGVLFDGRMWVYSWSARKLFGVDVNGSAPVKEIAITCDDPYFPNLVNPLIGYPLALSIVSDQQGGYQLFLMQITGSVSMPSTSAGATQTDDAHLLFFAGNMSADADTIALKRPFSQIKAEEELKNTNLANTNTIPYVVSRLENGAVKYYTCTYRAPYASGTASFQEYVLWCSLEWDTLNSYAEVTQEIGTTLALIMGNSFLAGTYIAYSGKNRNEVLALLEKADRSGEVRVSYGIQSKPDGIFKRTVSGSTSTSRITNAPSVSAMLSIAGTDRVLVYADLGEMQLHWLGRTDERTLQTSDMNNLSLPSGARIFRDACAYLWGKDMFLLFVGTGLIFSRTLETGSFGYLDTTSVLGQITQGGYLDYAQDEGTLYIVGQDTANRVKVAKIVLNTLYDYASDGAWLPLIASNGVPAYIKAKETEG